MSRTCTVCTHPARATIDAALVAGTPYRDIALQQHVGVMAVQRHAADHVPAHLAKAAEAAEVSAADRLLAELERLRRLALAILARASNTGELRTALAGIREARGCLELEAKIRGELDERPVFNVLISAEYLQLQATLLEALAPYPQARLAVADALGRLDRQEASSNGYAR